MSRFRFGILVFLYALLMLYASTIVGVFGPHYVPLDPTEALHRLIHMRYVEHGSDQRSDWMGNLVMAVPLGFLVAGALMPRRSMSALTGAGAFILCFAFILLVKYAQLFFPPRTVTINYVIAQSLGAACGIVLLGIMRSPLAELGRGLDRLESLLIILRIYTALLILFMLMPLDFALNADDLAAQFARLPASFTAISGADRPAAIRFAQSAVSILAATPIGAMLTLMKRGRVYVGRSTAAAAWLGCFLMIGVYAAATLVISASPSLPAVGFYTAGIALGAWFMHWLTRRDPDLIRHELGDLVPWVAPAFLLTLLAVNGLLSLTWTRSGPAAEDFSLLGLVPLYNYYIVSKAQAAKNIVAHVAMYAPVGVMVWLRMTHGSGKAAAFVIAALLSALIEAGRFLLPGLEPDINAVPLAGLSAAAAAALMPGLWQMLSSVAIGRTVSVSLHPSRGTIAPPANWRERGRDGPIGPATGDVEDY